MTTQTTGPMIKTGSAKCTEAAIKKAVADYADAGNEGAVLATGDSDSYRCTDGWLVAQVNVGPAAEAATVTVLWQGEGQFWVPQDRAKVCPKPSKVPASIYDLACNSN
uniref:Unannotated protein n=1 Tax=freshwater metagenome TaxID=449393 RepID=A0A6J5Z5I5_9ZZZZ